MYIYNSKGEYSWPKKSPLLVYINNDLEKTSDYISVCKALLLLLWFSSSDNCYVFI
jgi:hypothetical protein